MGPATAEPDWSGSLVRVSEYASCVVADAGEVSADDSPVLAAASTLLARTARNLEAVRLLAESGYAPESYAIARMVFEDMIDLAYIAVTPAERAQEWCDHCIIRRVFWARVAREWDPNVPVSPEVAMASERIADQDLAARRTRGDKEWRLWPGVTRRARARAAGMLGLYDDEYQFLSDMTHSSGFTLQLYSKSNETSDRVSPLSPQSTLRVFAARSAIEAAIQLGATASRLGLGWDVGHASALVDATIWSYGE